MAAPVDNVYSCSPLFLTRPHESHLAIDVCTIKGSSHSHMTSDKQLTVAQRNSNFLLTQGFANSAIPDLCKLKLERSRYSDWLGAGRPWGRISSPGRGNIFLSTSSIPVLGPTHPIQWAPGALPPGVKRQGREADHSPPSSTEVKKYGAIPPLPRMPSWHSA
jgi:hypothetical protein